MSDFIASNGIPVTLTADGRLIVENPDHTYPATVGAGDHVDALREFFQDALDKALGRWRWPEDPDYVVYATDVAGGRLVRILRESDPRILEMTRGGAQHEADQGSRAARAALAYFDTHPEPKPWHDAKPGEVWVFDWNGAETVFRVAPQRELLPITAQGADWYTDLGSPSLSNGRRIWPEAKP